MLHFQVFTSAESPLFHHPPFVPPFGPFHSPYSSHYPFSRPPLFRSFLSLSLFLFSVSPYPPTYPLSFSALFQTRRFTRDRPSSSASSRRRARRLSRGRVFTSTPVNVPLARLYRAVFLQSRGSLRPARSPDLFQTQRSSHRHASSLSLPPGRRDGEGGG